jgi:hypothetical protein
VPAETATVMVMPPPAHRSRPRSAPLPVGGIHAFAP